MPKRNGVVLSVLCVLLLALAYLGVRELGSRDPSQAFGDLPSERSDQRASEEEPAQVGGSAAQSSVREGVLAKSLSPEASVDSASELPQLGVIAGRVVDSDGLSLQHARIVCDAASGERHTDAKGAFLIRDVPPGKTHVRVTYFGLSARAEVEVPSGGVAEGIELRLDAGGWITGEVRDANGELAADCPIGSEPNGGWLSRVRTDAGGQFRLGPMAAGEYRVYTTLHGENSAVGTAAMLEGLISVATAVEIGETVHVVLAQSAGPKPWISGVIRQDGQPLHKAQVMLVLEGESYFSGPRTGFTDADGVFRFRLADQGHHLLLVFPPGDHHVRVRRLIDVPPEGLENLELNFGTSSLMVECSPPSMAEGGFIRLRALAQPIGLRQLSAGYGQSLERADDESPAVARFENLEPGTYQLIARCSSSASLPRLVEIIEGGHQRIHVQLTRARGVVVLQPEGITNSKGEPWLFSVCDSTGSCVHTSTQSFGMDGGASLVLLPKGRYRVFAASNERCATSDWFELAESQQAGPTLVPLESKASARVVLRANRSKQPAAASFRLFNDENLDVSAIFLPERSFEHVPLRRAEGRFGPLPPGTYRAEVTGVGGRRTSANVRLRADETVVVDIELDD